MTIDKNLQVNGDTNIKKLNANSTITNNLTVESDAKIENNLVVDKRLIIGDSLDVGEKITTSKLDVLESVQLVII